MTCHGLLVAPARTDLAFWVLVYSERSQYSDLVHPPTHTDLSALPKLRYLHHTVHLGVPVRGKVKGRVVSYIMHRSSLSLLHPLHNSYLTYTVSAAEEMFLPFVRKRFLKEGELGSLQRSSLPW